ncbi:nucleotidyltransferase domain-containing protein, partial [Kitasatospora sp. NPDC059571]|uniref:nucleotidyltransferase domain-containing protein n=1 Tax=Kitasatospora sp. NPDC059571 TaxID=3346871 RepID=UPI00368DD951
MDRSPDDPAVRPAGFTDADRAALARRPAEVPGVVGVCLGGSRARGTHRPDRDHDFGLYYRRPLDPAACAHWA